MSAGGDKKSWIVLELLNWTAEHFRKAGIRNPRLDAEVLLGKVLGLERIMLYARFDHQVVSAQRKEFRELVKRRAAHEPLQYLMGEWEFFGRQFELNPAVMIPRQETELVVEKCLEKIPEHRQGLWAADICTGSGAIAVSLAAERSALQVVATDSSGGALKVAHRNAKRHGVDERIAFAQGDLAEPVGHHLPEGRTGIDLMVSNPPYVPTEQIQQLQSEVRDHEPRAALDGGADGLDVIRRLVPLAGQLVVAGGWLVLELGEDQAKAVKQIVGRTGAFDVSTLEVTADPGGCERVLCARKSAL